MNIKRLTIILFILLPAFVMAGNHIVISKQKMRLYVVNERQNIIFQCPIACGMYVGKKQRAGDHKTPEGKFKINMIHDSSSWKFDFKDGKGPRAGAYGPYFFRLNVPGFKDIGIHGTVFPESIGTRSSRGCIRLRNEDIERLYPLCHVGMTVIIGPDEVENPKNQ